LASLTAKFASSEQKSQDSEKLLHLYWNRAELKKEFAGMRKEQFKLQDRIKQQEGATARLQQKLDHLEDLLLDPQWVGNVVVYYQLRGLALRCQRKLARFAEQLKQQREQRQHNNILVSWNEERTSEARSLESQILERREDVHLLEDQLQSERHRLMSMSGFLKVFRRRSVTAILDSLAGQIDLAREEEDAVVQKLETVKNRKPPDNEGLDILTKRSINLMILAFAQQLYLHFTDDNLAKLVKEANEKSVGAINYGDQTECDQILERIKKCVEVMDTNSDFAGVLQQRAKLISEKATFPNDDEAVPVSASVATLFSIDDESVKVGEVDILGENYWEISAILSR